MTQGWQGRPGSWKAKAVEARGLHLLETLSGASFLHGAYVSRGRGGAAAWALIAVETGPQAGDFPPCPYKSSPGPVQM